MILDPKFSSSYDGTVPVIALDSISREIVIDGFMNQEAWDRTLETGFAYYYNRARRVTYMRGVYSGNYQIVRKIIPSCGNELIILNVERVFSKQGKVFNPDEIGNKEVKKNGCD